MGATSVATVIGESGVAEAATGYGGSGYGDGGYGGSTDDTAVAVSTQSPTAVGETSVTLNGSLDDLGGASSANCYFQYRESDASTWTATSEQTLSSTGSFSESVSGLTDGVEYECRAVAKASDGDSDTGSIDVFATTEATATVSTQGATNVDDTSVTLEGSLDALGNASSADCYFEYRETGASVWNTTAAETKSSTGSYRRDVTGLTAGTDYEYRTAADASDGDSDTGSTVTVATTAPPTIDSYTVTEAGSPNPHAEITADWDVGDASGDLNGVTVDVIDTDKESVVDSHSYNVSGSDAANTDKFKIKHANGKTYDVTLTVTDTAGSSSSSTRTVAE